MIEFIQTSKRSDADANGVIEITSSSWGGHCDYLIENHAAIRQALSSCFNCLFLKVHYIQKLLSGFIRDLTSTLQKQHELCFRQIYGIFVFFKF